MEEQKKRGKGLVVITVILLLACLGMGAFIFVNKDKLMAKEIITTTVSGEPKNVNGSADNCDPINYDLDTNNYGLSASGVGILVNVDKTRKKATISYNGATISQTFNLGWVTVADTHTYETIDTKTFDKKITQVIIDGAGQSATSSAIIYLMEDGTVEYVPILTDINANWGQPDNSKKFNSYGKLSNVSDVIGLLPAEASGYHTVLARKVDGTVIDLTDTLKATGNFK